VADAAWRCSECGTINEPVANACRTCGRWPSLFDLEASAVDEDRPPVTRPAEPERYRDPEPVVVEELELPQLLPDASEAEPPDDEDVEISTPGARWRRIFGSVIVPLAVVVYLLVSFVADR
jgi:predicted ATP-dependent serine protease